MSQRTEILCTIFRHWIWATSCQPHSTFVVSRKPLGSRCPPPKAGESNGLGLRLLRQDWRACTDRTQCHGQFWYQAWPFGCHRSSPWELGPVCGYNHGDRIKLYIYFSFFKIWAQVMEKSTWTTVKKGFFPRIFKGLLRMKWCEVKRHTTCNLNSFDQIDIRIRQSEPKRLIAAKRATWFPWGSRM